MKRGCGLFTGRLNSEYFLAGARRLSPDLAADAIQTKLAAPLGISREEAALGILAIAESHMVNAIRLVSVERGLDPRDFTLALQPGCVQNDLANRTPCSANLSKLGVQTVLTP